MDDDDIDEEGNPRRYILPKAIHFGYHRKFHASLVEVSGDGLKAIKLNPRDNYAGGVVYSDRPLSGHCEFEVELTEHGTNWSGNFKLGIAHFKTGKLLVDFIGTIPRYSPEARNNCVWSDERIFDKIQNKGDFRYGKKRLDDLRKGDRLGLQISNEGVLSFYVNDTYQGVASTNAYVTGYDTYAIVDHYGNAISTSITKAIMRVNINLQDSCLDIISSSLQSKLDLQKLPLPDHMKEKLKLYVY